MLSDISLYNSLTYNQKCVCGGGGGYRTRSRERQERIEEVNEESGTIAA